MLEVDSWLKNLSVSRSNAVYYQLIIPLGGKKKEKIYCIVSNLLNTVHVIAMKVSHDNL